MLYTWNEYNIVCQLHDNKNNCFLKWWEATSEMRLQSTVTPA